MIFGGCDVGSLTGKAVILEDENIRSTHLMLSTPIPQKTARLVMDEALKKANLKLEDIDYIVGTGYGRIKIEFAKTNISEISCHGKGAHWLIPTVRTVIDVGGQDTKVISLNDQGEVIDFLMNDKCAAGTGKFLEQAAKTLDLELEKMGSKALRSENPCKITSQCSVFADSEIISLLAENEDIADIAAGVHKSIGSRLITLVKRIGVRRDIAITGGVAKNLALVKFLEEELGEIKRMPADPQLVGAIGAALFARDKLKA